jgi:hypothetical protein
LRLGLTFPDNAVEELYYLEMNYARIVLISIKNNPDYDGKAILRSFETKKIKQIRNLLI